MFPKDYSFHLYCSYVAQLLHSFCMPLIAPQDCKKEKREKEGIVLESSNLSENEDCREHSKITEHSTRAHNNIKTPHLLTKVSIVGCFFFKNARKLKQAGIRQYHVYY